MDRDDDRDPDRSLPFDAPPSAEEIAAAEALRNALAHAPEENVPGDDDAALARALFLAHAPPPIDDAEHRAIVARAIERAEVRKTVGRRRGATVVAFVAGGLALAAAIALRITEPAHAPSAVSTLAEGPLVPVRSTQPLFREPFARTGGESARIDRIASARASDLRDNRFAAWGVR